MAYHHLTLSERSVIEIRRKNHISIRQIARELGRCAGTISRELRRNTPVQKSYHMGSASRLNAHRRSNQPRLKILKDPKLQALVDKHLRAGWSPEQISGRLCILPRPIRISAGAIYRYVRWALKHAGKKAKRYRRCPRKYRKRPGSAFGPAGKKPISERCEAANQRLEQGNWEADTIVTAPGKPALLVFVDRKTRYLIVRKVQSGKSQVITREVITAMYGAGKRNRKSITLDNGSEFAGWRDFAMALRMQVYFCQPHSPWQRPTVENTNGLIRQLTRKKDLQAMTQKEVDDMVLLINNRPRKCLNWRTAAEEFG